jgi:transposase-like protein
MSWKYSQFFKRRIVRDYLAGNDIRSIADRHKISPQSARSIVIQAGVLRPRTTAKQRIIALASSGLRIREIAQLAGCSESRVRQVRRECGLSITGSSPSERVARAVFNFKAIRDAERRAP